MSTRYAFRSHRNIAVLADGRLDIGMEKELIPINEVVISTERYQNVSGIQIGHARIDIQTIKEFNLYKSSIPVEYGGRIASVFSVSTREGNKNQLTARGGISPVTGHIAVEGQLNSYRMSIFGTAIVSLSGNFKFGNYASQ